MTIRSSGTTSIASSATHGGARSAYSANRNSPNAVAASTSAETVANAWIGVWPASVETAASA